ncbi:helix-turn-helix transcriptional regulator [Murimonas intestini]|uniref:helix-turn-helix transcriptional regulator n=1 Tax=Murimonas intestini TaxID=1337051 RepID=UPI00165243E8|nr:helix-turn-helix transcriptional regulator [Murimonas intestini]
MGKLKEQLKNIRKPKYRLRMLMAFFAVAVLAIGFVDIVVFRSLSAQIREESEKETLDFLKNVTSSYESQITQYQEKAELLFRNLDVKAYLLSDGSEDLYLKSIYESMKALAGNTQGITSVVLFHEERVLASYDTGMILQNTKEELVERIHETVSDKELFFISADSRQIKRQMVVFWSAREYLYGPSSYGVALVVQLDVLQQKTALLDQNRENPPCIFYQDGEAVVWKKDAYEEKRRELFHTVQMSDQKEGVLYETIDGKQYKISFAAPGEGRFSAIWLQEMSPNQERIRQALQMILAATVAGMAIMAVIVWILSGWMYRPLGMLFRNIFELAGSREDRTAGNSRLGGGSLEDVNQSMALLRDQIRSNVFVRYLRQEGQEQMDEQVFGFGGKTPKSFLVMVMRYCLDDWNKNDEIAAFIRENKSLAGTDELQCYQVSRSEIIMLICRGTNEEADDGGEAAAGELLSELEDIYGLQGCIGISGCEGTEQLPDAYHRANMLTGYYILSKKIQVIPEKLLGEKMDGPVQEPEKERIMRCIKENKEDDMEECIRSLLDNLTAYHIKAAKNYLKMLTADVIRLSERISGEKNTEYEIYLEDFLTYEIFIGQEDIETWLCQLFLQVKAQLKAWKQPSASSLMDEAVVYIEEHCQECCLSVELVSEHFGVSVSYFSKLFNQYTGKTFPDYMKQLRLEKARKILLEDPDRSISDIAKEVGFNSSSYFSAAFRKYYGVTPSQIKKN